MNTYRIFYKYWLKGYILDGNIKVKQISINKEKAKSIILKKHNYPKNSQAEKYNIIGIQIYKLVK